MKKIIYIFLLTIFFLTGCSNSKLTKITIDELNKKLTDKETFILYFAKEDSKLEKTLNTVLENNNLEGYKIDASEISTEDKNKLEPQIAYETPSIVFIIDGKDPSILSHVKDESITTKEIVNRLKDMNFIKK